MSDTFTPRKTARQARARDTVLGILQASAEIVVHCKSGGRSQRAIAFLESQGFGRLKNLTGGILAWIREVDPSLTPY
jgi:adenylyltransferase/sulfurtransferase